MDLSVIAFLGLLVAVALLRIVELQISRRHQQEMIARGAAKVDEPRFRWMVALHTAVLLAAALEVVLLRRPFIPILAAVMFAIFLAANVVRWWVIRTLGNHWNVQVMDSTRLGVICSGPFRYVRHPNYAAVFAEMLALPLIHTAWITAIVGSLAHVAVLSQRLSTEERRPRLHVGGHDVQIALPVHAVHVDMVAVVVEHHDADRDSFCRGQALAGLGNAFGRGEIDRREIMDLLGRLAADDELRGHVLRQRRRAERKDSERDRTRDDESHLHAILLVTCELDLVPCAVSGQSSPRDRETP